MGFSIFYLRPEGLHLSSTDASQYLVVIHSSRGLPSLADFWRPSNPTAAQSQVSKSSACGIKAAPAPGTEEQE